MKINALHVETVKRFAQKVDIFGQLIPWHMYQTWIIVMFVHYVQ